VITRTKERVKITGEVFTPPELVNEMLDQIPQTVWDDPTKTFLEPSAGDGNFVIAILERKIKLGHTPTQAISTMYAVELMPDNHERLCERALEVVGDTPEHREIISRNFVCANALEYDYSFGEVVEDEFFVY
jgi:hypothetical protein